MSWNRVMTHAHSLTRGGGWSIFFLVMSMAFVVGTGVARAQERVGVFWDPAYSETEAVIPAIPSVISAHIVIKDAPAGGVVGWEMCLDTQDRALVVNVNYNGQTVNLLDPPCFFVGVAAPLMPVSGDILLASVDLLVSDLSPITVALLPTPDPSLPGQISYVPAAAPGTLVALETVTGTPDVGGINLDNPWPVFSPNQLDFGTHATGTTTTMVVTITNAGVGDFIVDPEVAPGCDGFVVTAPSSPVTLVPGDAVEVEVAFSPAAVQPYACSLAIGTDMPTVALSGAGKEPTYDYTQPSRLSFGTLPVGDSRVVSAILKNTGDGALIVAPVLNGCGNDFVFASNVDSTAVQPGQIYVANVRFQPQTPDTLTCELRLGELMEPIVLSGIGEVPVLDYSVIGDLEFGEVALNDFQDRTVTISNTGEVPIQLTPALSGCLPSLSLQSGGTPVLLLPGASWSVRVRYRPATTEPVDCFLDLGAVVPAIPVTGTARERIIDLLVPSLVEFGTVEVGQAVNRSLTVANRAPDGINLHPALLDCGTGMILNGVPAEVYVSPGGVLEIPLHYAPASPETVTCLLTLGDGLPTTSLTAVAVLPAPEWQIDPASVSFETTPPGGSRQATVRVTNTGFVVIEMMASLPDSSGPFQIITGGGAYQLQPGTFRDIRLEFAPSEVGAYAVELNLGDTLPPVAVTGTCGGVVEACSVQPGSLDFGTVIVTSTTTRVVAVTNIGNVSLTLTPAIADSAFTVDPAPFTLPPGQSQPVQVHFHPLAELEFSGVLTFGNSACPDVPLLGAAEYPVVTNGDRVGIFFDANYLFNAVYLDAYTLQSGYLVLKQPSDIRGVGGWEGRFSLNGNGLLLDWTFAGQALNLGEAPDYIVGLATPLPWAMDVLLAQFQFMLLEPGGSLFFKGEPVTTPTIANQMTWIDAGNDLHLMQPDTGWPVLATVNPGGAVSVVAPTPTASLAGQSVELAWPAQPEPDAEYNVYRRLGAEAAVRVTAEPVATGAVSVRYVDEPRGLPAGAHLFYSYTVVTGGVELARSAEVEIVLPELGVARTGLLPNVPNPFNPRTEIHFALSQPIRIRVAVYDLTGRLVRVLQDGYLEAGLYSRTWTGQDARGRSVASGAYYVRLQGEGQLDTRKIMLLR